MQLTYKAVILDDPFGSKICVFDDVPDALGMADTDDAALEEARQSLIIALEARLRAGHALPEPRATDGIDVTVLIDDGRGKVFKLRA